MLPFCRMYLETIKRAASTARMLGYTVIRGYEGYGGTVYPPEKDGRSQEHLWVVYVLSPAGVRVLRFIHTGWKHHPFLSNRMLPPSNQHVLGHWLTRLHMEKYYGIKTEHYWE